MQILWRSQPYTPDPTSAKDNNRANYNWLKENQPEKLAMEDICKWNNCFIRTQDYYYDIPATPKEQYILCYDIRKYWGEDYLEDIIEQLQKKWYMIFFNNIENQSVPEVRHWHILKF